MRMGSVLPITEDDKDLKCVIDDIANVFGQQVFDTYRYPSYYHLVREFGRFYTPHKYNLPELLHKGLPKQCFLNAFTNMRGGQYFYCEGFAFSKILNGFPFEHAWIIDASGVAYETTWEDNHALAYYGICFTENFVKETVLDRGVSGVMFSEDIMRVRGFMERGFSSDMFIK